MKNHGFATVLIACLSVVCGCGKQAPDSSADNNNVTSPEKPVAVAQLTLEEANRQCQEVMETVKSGKAQEGFNKLNEILKSCPDCAQAWDMRANMLAQSAQPVSAIRDLSALLKLQPKHTEAWNMRGFLLLTLNRFPEAIKDFDQAVQLNSEFSKAYNNRGLARIAMKDFRNSLNDFNLAIQHKPDYTDAYNNRGYALLEIGNFSKAIQNFSEAIKLDPKYANAYNNRGLVRIKTGEIEEAIKDFSQAISLLPYVEKHYQHRRDAYHSLGKDSLAKADEQMIVWIRELAVINDKLIKSPKQADLLANRGFQLLKMNDSPRAQHDFEAVLKQEAGHIMAQLGMAQIAHQSKQYERAIELCDKILAQDQNLAAYSLRGDVAFAQGDFDQAVRDYQLAQRFDAQVAQAFQLRASWHEKAGRTEQAKSDYESAKLLDPRLKSTASTDSNPLR